MFSYTPGPTRDANTDSGGGEWTGADGVEHLLEAVAEVVRARGRAAGVEVDVTREDVVRIIVDRMLSGLPPGEEKALRDRFGLPALAQLEDVQATDWQAGLVKLRSLVV